MSAGPPIILNGPLPVPYSFGLFSAATLVSETDERWGNGAQVRMYPCTVPNAFDPCATGTFRPKSEQPTSAESLLFSAWTAYLHDECAAGGFGSDEDLKRRAQLAFGATEQWIVESELAFGGIMPSNPYLADSNGNVGPTLGPSDALAYLEKKIGQSGKAGIIHADRATASVWSSLGALRVVGDKLLTFLGTPIAAGGGYAGVAVDGEAPPDDATQSWAFATGGVEIRRSPEIFLVPGTLAEAMDRSVNLVKYKAERDYLVTWDRCLQQSVLVDRSL
jgi:hypothetical protein